MRYPTTQILVLMQFREPAPHHWTSTEKCRTEERFDRVIFHFPVQIFHYFSFVILGGREAPLDESASCDQMGNEQSPMRNGKCPRSFFGSVAERACHLGQNCTSSQFFTVCLAQRTPLKSQIALVENKTIFPLILGDGNRPLR